MKYRKSEAKDYAKEHIFKGTWVATFTPYTPDYKIDEKGVRHNIRHLIDNLEVDGMFLNGLMAEGFHHTIPERKRIFQLAAEEANGKILVMPYTSDPVLENVIDMTKYAEDTGADFAIMINPKFYFEAMNDEGIYQYYKTVADKVNIGIAIFNQIEHGYLMSPQLIARLSKVQNIVGVKNITSLADQRMTRILCGDNFVVAVDEEIWLTNWMANGVAAMIPSIECYCYQSKKLKLIKEYTTQAMKGDIAKAAQAYNRLEPIRRALQKVLVRGKRQAVYKVWTQELGMVGGDGRVRVPQAELTEAEKKAVIAAVRSTELV